MFMIRIHYIKRLKDIIRYYKFYTKILFAFFNAEFFFSYHVVPLTAGNIRGRVFCPENVVCLLHLLHMFKCI